MNRRELDWTHKRVRRSDADSGVTEQTRDRQAHREMRHDVSYHEMEHERNTSTDRNAHANILCHKEEQEWNNRAAKMQGRMRHTVNTSMCATILHIKFQVLMMYTELRDTNGIRQRVEVQGCMHFMVMRSRSAVR